MTNERRAMLRAFLVLDWLAAEEITSTDPNCPDPEDVWRELGDALGLPIDEADDCGYAVAVQELMTVDDA